MTVQTLAVISRPDKLASPVSEIVQLHGEIIAAARMSLDKGIRIGELLSQEKSRLSHGQWLPWLKSHVPFTERTARNYLRVYEERDRLKSETVSDLTAAYRQLAAPEQAARGKDIVHVSHNSGENEWYTPSTFIEAARLVMGSIDCDPASSVLANKTVKAKQFFTKEQDGLTKTWSGNVWLNPPYAQPLISQFAEAVDEKFANGEIKQCIILTNNATETEWFALIASWSSALCFPSSRIRFIDVNGEATGAPLQGQVFTYLGPNPRKFRKHFAAFGLVAATGRAWEDECE